MAGSASARVWTDEEILETFGSADEVSARDGAAVGTVLPPVLTRGSSDASMPSWAAEVSRLHPDDRMATAQLWWDSVQDPGELHRLMVRSRVGGAWRLVELCSLNLLHQPGVRSVLISTTDHGPTEVRDLRETEPRHEAPAWTYQEVDPVGTLLRTEGDADAVFGRKADELVGTNIVDLLHPDDHEPAIAMWIELMSAPGSTRVIELRSVHPDGTSLWLEATVTNRLDESLHAMVVISLDVSERHAQAAAIRASQEEFRTLAEEVPIAVFRADAFGRVTFGNGPWFDLTSDLGVVEFVVDLVAPDDRAEWRDQWDAFVSTDAAPTLELVCPTPDHRRLLSMHARRVLGSTSEPTFVGVLTDVTDEAELRHRADHDSLTGLLNREAFGRVLREALENAATVAVAFVDLDGFKQINDALGHEAGDAVLGEVARRLTACVRPGDAVARYGGDEFIVMCSGLADAADSLHARITAALEAPARWVDTEWPLQASIGCVCAVEGDEVVGVIRRADQAMYDDKRQRRASRIQR